MASRTSSPRTCPARSTSVRDGRKRQRASNAGRQAAASPPLDHERDQRHAVRRRDAGALDHLHGFGSAAQVGVPIDLPQTQAKALDQDREPLTVSVNGKGQVFLQNSEIKVEDLVAKLEAITQARGGTDERIYVRGDRKVDYGPLIRVLPRLSPAAFPRLAP